MSKINNLIILKIFLFALSIFLCFYKLPNHEIQLWDESTNINVVKESLDSSCPLILKYQNKPFFEKPPLWYWMTMGTVKVFGENIFSFRFISAISGVFLTLLIYHIAKSFWGEIAGIVAGLSILATGHLFINNVSGYFSTHSFRSADLDAVQILFIIISFWFFSAGLSAKKNFDLKKNLILSFLFSGFAVMAKGIIGVLPVIIGIVFMTISRFLKKRQSNIFVIAEKLFTPILDIFFGRIKIIYLKYFSKIFYLVWDKIKPPKISIKTFILPFFIFLLIILPWHLFMYFKFGDKFIDEYFIYHTVKRAAESLEGHNESIWFYLQMLFDTKVFFSGVLLCFGMLIAVAKKKFLSDFKRVGSIFGIIFPLIIFTIIPTKLAWYNLYVYPFAVLLIGFLASMIPDIRNKTARNLVSAIIFAYIFAGIFRNIIWIWKL